MLQQTSRSVYLAHLRKDPCLTREISVVAMNVRSLAYEQSDVDDNREVSRGRSRHGAEGPNQSSQGTASSVLWRGVAEMIAEQKSQTISHEVRGKAGSQSAQIEEQQSPQAQEQMRALRQT